MLKLIDLHLHTIFSDGSLQGISSFSKEHQVLSVTDHNSIEFFKNNSMSLYKTKIVIGCEVTIDRNPDVLVYFPKLKSYLSTLEKKLAEIRHAEATIIQACYKELGYTNWEYDINRAFPKNQAIKDARTRDLAAIIYLHRNHVEYANGYFDYPDLLQARKIRWNYTEDNGNPFYTGVAFDVENSFSGESVLAHPVRTALKMCRKSNVSQLTLQESLEKLVQSFKEQGGKGIEIEYFSEEYLKKNASVFSSLIAMRELIIDFSITNNMYLTLGTDSHSIEEYNCGYQWIKKQYPLISEYLPTWAKDN